MEMELSLHPDDAAALTRAKPRHIVVSKRSRPRTVTWVWHDTPDRALRAAGLSLREYRGVWRLERLFPNDGLWLPATPAPVLAEGTRSVMGEHGVPDGLVPVVALDGQQSTMTVSTEAGDAVLDLLRGTVRGVMEVAPVCRCTLRGPDQAVRAVAVALAGVYRLAVPTSGLAAEAMGIADGWAPPSHAFGPPPSTDDVTVAAAFAAALGYLTTVLVRLAPMVIAAGPDDPEPVHQMRVAVRRARSVITVFNPVLACPLVTEIGQGLKALGAVLGPARDWDVFVTETLPPVSAAFPDDQRLSRLEAAAARQRAACHADLVAWLAGTDFPRLTVTLVWLASSGEWHDGLETDRLVQARSPLHEFARAIMRRRWRKLLATGKAIEALAVPELHGLRLRVKRTRYAAEVLLPAPDSRPVRRLMRRLSVLQQRLGVLNDGAVAAGLIDQLGGPGGRHAYAAGLVLGFLAARAAQARPRIHKAWSKIDRLPAFWA